MSNVQLNNDLRHCCDSLHSNKITERRKKCSELLDYLQRQDVLNLLNRNSINNEGLTWDIILTSAHRGLMKESDKLRDDLRNGKNVTQLDSAKFCSLVSTVASRSTKDGTHYLSVNPLLQCIKHVLQEAFFTKHFGSTYLNILRHQILTSHHYCTQINGDTWKELLQMTKTIYADRPAQEANTLSSEKNLILSTLSLIIKKGGLHSFLALEVKKLFPLLTGWIKAAARQQYLHENLVRLALTTCQVVAHECRMAVCKFGEEVMPEFRNIYEYKADNTSKKKEVLLDWLVLQVCCHHPAGTRKGSSSAYAGDWDVWSRHLQWMYQLIEAEVRHTLRQRSIKHLRANFITLSVLVCRQIFETNSREQLEMSMISNLNETAMLEGNAPKRIRLETGVSAILDRVSLSPQADMWPWLSLLTEMSLYCPQLISETELVSLLQFCSEQLQTCKDPTTMENLYRCANALLNVENSKEAKLIDSKKLNQLWNSVWDTCLRALGLNLCEAFSHQLVQHIMKNKKLVKLEKLLSLYVSGAINRTEHSLTTLYCLASSVSITEHLDTEKCKDLQQWVLPDRQDCSRKYDWACILPCTELVAKNLMALTVKGKVPCQHNKPLETDKSELERFYLITLFEASLSLKSSDKESFPDKSNSNILQVDDQLFNHMISLLTREHFISKAAKENVSNSDAVHIFTLHFSLSFQIVATMQNWGLPPNEKLETFLYEMCDAVAECIQSVLMVRGEIPTLKAVLQRLANINQLISSNPPLFVQQLVTRLATSYITKACNKLATMSQRVLQSSNDFDFGDSETMHQVVKDNENPLDPGMLTGWAEIQLVAYQVNLEYSRWNLELMARLLQIPISNNSDISPTCSLHMGLAAARTVCSLPTVDDDLLDDLLILMQSICRLWHPSDVVVIAILDIFQDLCRHIEKSEENQEKFTILVFGVLKFLKKQKYGPHVCCRYANLLSHIAQVDDCAKWSSQLTEDNTIKPLAHELLTFITSPFHQVRLTACQKISILFQSSSSNLIQQMFFDLLKLVNEIFMVEGDLEAIEALDEGILRTSTALHCLGVIVTLTSMWRSKAVFNIFFITVQKRLNTDLVRKMLGVVAKEVGSETVIDFLNPLMSEVVWSWHEKVNTLSEFPFQLLGYSTESQFLNKYLSVIVCVLVNRRANQELARVAAVINQTIPAVLEVCYPALLGSILPRFADDNQQKTATVIISTIEQYIGDEKVKTLLMTKLQDVLRHMFSLIHDSAHLKTLCNSQLTQLPEPMNLSFSTQLVSNAIQYIQDNSPKSETPLIVFLSQEKPRLLQKVLLSLYERIHQTTLSEYKLLYCHQFVVMCGMLADVLSVPEFHMARYTVTWVSQALLHLIYTQVKHLAIYYLHHFLALVLASQSRIVDALLPTITSSLIPLADENTVSGKKVLEILEMLLIENANILPRVRTLDPLPAKPMFANIMSKYNQLRYASPLSSSLRSEIQHVIDSCGSKDLCHPQGLQNLRTQLSQKKAELAALYGELRETRGFSEDCERSILHQLIGLLVKLTSTDHPEIRNAAACCLGELGPGNLTTLGLRPEISPPTTQPLESFLQTVVSHLLSGLFDKDFPVVQAVCDALYSLFGNFHQLTDILTTEQAEVFYPFINVAKKQRKQQVTVDEEEISHTMELFCPEQPCSHKLWVTRLLSGILHAAQFGYLSPVCDFKEEMASELFPLAISLLLENSKKSNIIDLVVQQINCFFDHHLSNDSKDEVYRNRDSVITVIKTVHIVRKYLETPRKINYLYVAKAALFCSAYFTSVMYAELWASEFNSDRKHLDSEGSSQLEFIEDNEREKGEMLQSLLREAYMKIGEPDAVYGCGDSHLLDQLTQIQHYQYEGKYLRVVQACDIQLFLNPSVQLQGLESALHYCGLYNLAGQSESYEACWRLGRWEKMEPQTHTYDSLVYTALRSLLRTDSPLALQAIREARDLVTQSLATTSLEAATNVYLPLAKLQALQEIEDTVKIKNFQSVLEKWSCQDLIKTYNFTVAETVLAQRMIIIKMKQDKSLEASAKLLISAVESARLEGFYSIAQSWLSNLVSWQELPRQQLLSVELLKAQLYWDQEETSTARHLLRRLLGQLKTQDLKHLYAKALHTYGSWVAHTRTEQAQPILDKYLLPAVDKSGVEFKFEAARSLAHYADIEYQNRLAYVKSASYVDKIKHITESMNKTEKLLKTAEGARKILEIDRQTRIDLQKSINLHDKQSKIDQTEVENAQKELDFFLILAIRHYLLSLKIGDTDNLSVFRVVSLWQSNFSHTELLEELSNHIDDIPSYKFLPVLPQLVAKVKENASDTSTSMLHKLIERCAKDHPHHVLPLILALVNTNKDLDHSSSKGSPKPEGRILGAQKMLNRLKQVSHLKSLIKDMVLVSEAYISLANSSHSAEKAKAYKIGKTELILKVRGLPTVLCPTVTLPVSKVADYKQIIGIQSFGETYTTVGGINVPKKIVCICSDGMKRPQLVKGNDDLRQDAVMQQVFTIMNSLLRENKETQKRRLLIRTYKVVPLSQRSGVIEWCVNTTPLSTYLIGGGGVVGAHNRYRKQDWLPSVCRQKMGENAKSNNVKKLQVFQEICAHFKPVFRHFFFENYPDPGVWFERRLAYTHSVATSSMVGYILGLGDRHILNILIDERTAEVIHIDFGIAFEQGRTLVTPETVPFRLTRDIVDGMGVSGIEGVFRRSCEKTMEVLRECKSTIVTILEVLLYDPLYMWTMTPAQAIAKQSSKPLPVDFSQGQKNDGEVNKLAERALVRLKQKLQGIEEGGTTSVEGQVSKLIQEATDPVNLCRLFNGWQAHV